MFRLTLKLAIVGLIAHSAYRIGMPVWTFIQFRDAVNETATHADTPSFNGPRMTTDQILDRLAKSARDLNVPLGRDDFQLTHDKSGTVVDARYTVRFEYLPRTYYPYEFVIHAEGGPSRFRGTQ